jgi:hypothetical protein
MRRIVTLPVILGLTTAFALLPPFASADVTATAVLKSGQRHTGSNLAYRVDNRQVVVRTSQAEEPRIPVDQVAYIDFGGTPNPSNLNLSGSQEAVVMRDGSVLKGQIIELGHTNKADLNSPYLVIIRTENGDERRLSANQVARVYFAGGQPSTGGGGSAVTLPGNIGIGVSARQQWTPTGFTVRRGEWISVNATGEIKTSRDENDRATPNGTGRTHPSNPLPAISGGTLIGRIGNSRPFEIGSQKRFQAPAAGLLFLGVNDSVVDDNDGEFRVEIQRESALPR